MSYLGFCGTLGADYMQYMIADEIIVPRESRRFYTENILYMPHSYFVNDHKQARVERARVLWSRESRTDCGIESFCVFFVYFLRKGNGRWTSWGHRGDGGTDDTRTVFLRTGPQLVLGTPYPNRYLNSTRNLSDFELP